VRRRNRGQALAEFGLVLPLLVLLLMIIFDFGRLIYAYNTVGNAARAGERTNVVDQNTAVVQDRVMTTLLGLPPAGSAVAITWEPACTNPQPLKIGCMSTVKVSYPWNPITPVISRIFGPVNVEASASMPLERIYSTP
jgi:hypothetical protein